MSDTKTKIRRLQYKFKHNFLTFDNIVLLVALAFCLIWTWGSISAMSRNWELAETVISRQRELALLKLEVETTELENQYYKSTEYQELAARRIANKKLPGETVVYLPENTETAKNKHQTTEQAIVAAYTDDRTNLEQWLTFIFGI